MGTSEGASDIYDSGSLGTSTSDTVSGLPIEKQVQLEDANVVASLAYAGEKLGL